MSEIKSLMTELLSSGLPSPEAVDELPNQHNPTPTIHPLPAKEKMDKTINKTVGYF